MAATSYYLAVDKQAALTVFKRTSGPRIALAVLAGVPPQPAWEGCEVTLAEDGAGDTRRVVLGIAGPAAQAVQQALALAFERLGIAVGAQGAGAPPHQAPLARVQDGRWQSS